MTVEKVAFFNVIDSGRDKCLSELLARTDVNVKQMFVTSCATKWTPYHYVTVWYEQEIAEEQGAPR
jgi:hypothetical protein